MGQTSDIEAVAHRVMRAFYVLAVFVLVLVDGIALGNPFPEVLTQIVLICLVCIPALLFGVALYFASSRARWMPLEKGWRLRVAMTLMFILLPAFYVAFRYSFWSSDVDQSIVRWIVWAHLAACFALPFPIFDLVGSHSGLSETQRLMKRVMWDAPVAFEYLPGRAPVAAVWRRRRDLYQDGESIKVFQRTLSCHGPDARAASEMLAGKLSPKRALRVLDVGAGDGRFSSELFASLQRNGLRIESVVAVDPVDFRKEYESRLPTAVPLLDWTCRRFQESTFAQRFDLVLAVHSLYEALDSPAQAAASDTIGWLLDRAELGGHVVIALGSEMGRAYEFKEKALDYLIGPNARDIVGERLLLAEQLQGAAFRRTDSVIDMEDLLRAAEGGQPDQIRQWLSYFLRYPVSGDERAAEILQEWLSEMVLPAASLPENGFEGHLDHTAGAQSTRRVLPHKACIWLIEKGT